MGMDTCERKMFGAWVVLLVTMLGVVLPGVDSHGMMIQPPQRSSLWRFPARFPNATANYNDNELFCGGAGVMHNQNHHLCGVCGDAYHLPQPRPNEAGGLYGRGVIVETYQQGQIIDVTIRLTTNHYGYFVFKICPNNDVTRIVTRECLDKIILHPVDASGQMIGDRWLVSDHLSNDHKLRLQLPPDLTCTQCVLQWTYTAGNNWDCDTSGVCGQGAGPQETFVNCADVTIGPVGSNNPTQPPVTPLSRTSTNTPSPPVTTTRQLPTPTTTRTYRPASTTQPTAAPHVSTSNCHDATGFQGDDWCIANCARGFCPPTFCKCN